MEEHLKQCFLGMARPMAIMNTAARATCIRFAYIKDVKAGGAWLEGKRELQGEEAGEGGQKGVDMIRMHCIHV